MSFRNPWNKKSAGIRNIIAESSADHDSALCPCCGGEVIVSVYGSEICACCKDCAWIYENRLMRQDSSLPAFGTA